MKGAPGPEASRPFGWFSHLPLGVRCAIAAVLGATGAFGQAPYGAAVLLVICCALAFVMWRRTPQPLAAGLIGWAFGTGYFAHALVWIVEPFQVDAARDGWMAPFALGLMAGGLALFWAAAFWGARKLSSRAWPLVVTWTAVEIARAYFFTGFPWAGVSQIVVDGAAARVLAWAGPHGATLWLLSAAWALSLPAGPGRRMSLRAGQVLLLAALWAGLHIPTFREAVPLTGHTVRLVQPNAPQHLKWHPDWIPVFFERQLALTAKSPAPGLPPPDLVVWPETAIPWRLDVAQPALREIASAASGTPVALGVLRAEAGFLRNAMVLLEADGTPARVYDKHHLVPFGEYLPFADTLRGIGLRGLAEARGPGFAPGEGPAVLSFGPLGQGLPLICYEAVFSHDVNRAEVRADFLIQITNDAWFGQRAGPQQHLAQARMRAIEQGLPMVRAANTGISAMIDPYGRLTASLGLGVEGALDVRLPQPNAPTLYSMVGDTPVLALLLLGAGVALLRRGKRRGRGEKKPLRN